MIFSSVKAKAELSIANLMQRKNTVLTMLLLLILPLVLVSVKYQTIFNLQAAGSGEIKVYDTYENQDVQTAFGGEITQTTSPIVRLHVILPDWSQASVPSSSSLARSSNNTQSVLQSSTGPVEEWGECFGYTEGCKGEQDANGLMLYCRAFSSNANTDSDGNFRWVRERVTDADGEHPIGCTQNFVGRKTYCPNNPTSPAAYCNGASWQTEPVGQAAQPPQAQLPQSSTPRQGETCSVNDQSLCLQEGVNGLYCRQLSTESQGRWMTQTEALDACTNQATTGVQHALTPCSDTNLRTKHTYLCENGEYRAATAEEIQNRGLTVANPGGGEGVVCCSADSDCGGGTCDTSNRSTTCGSQPYSPKPYECRRATGGQQPTVAPTRVPDGGACTEDSQCLSNSGCVRTGQDRNDRVCRPRQTNQGVYTKYLIIRNDNNFADSPEREDENTSLIFPVTEIDGLTGALFKIPRYAVKGLDNTIDEEDRTIYVRFWSSNNQQKTIQKTIRLIAKIQPPTDDQDWTGVRNVLTNATSNLGRSVDFSKAGEGFVTFGPDRNIELKPIASYDEFDLRTVAYAMATRPELKVQPFFAMCQFFEDENRYKLHKAVSYSANSSPVFWAKWSKSTVLPAGSLVPSINGKALEDGVGVLPLPCNMFDPRQREYMKLFPGLRDIITNDHIPFTQKRIAVELRLKDPASHRGLNPLGDMRLIAFDPNTDEKANYERVLAATLEAEKIIRVDIAESRRALGISAQGISQQIDMVAQNIPILGTAAELLGTDTLSNTLRLSASGAPVDQVIRDNAFYVGLAIVSAPYKGTVAGIKVVGSLASKISTGGKKVFVLVGGKVYPAEEILIREGAKEIVLDVQQAQKATFLGIPNYFSGVKIFERISGPFKFHYTVQRDFAQLNFENKTVVLSDSSNHALTEIGLHGTVKSLDQIRTELFDFLSRVKNKAVSDGSTAQRQAVDEFIQRVAYIGPQELHDAESLFARKWLKMMNEGTDVFVYAYDKRSSSWQQTRAVRLIMDLIRPFPPGERDYYLSKLHVFDSRVAEYGYYDPQYATAVRKKFQDVLKTNKNLPSDVQKYAIVVMEDFRISGQKTNRAVATLRKSLEGLPQLDDSVEINTVVTSFNPLNPTENAPEGNTKIFAAWATSRQPNQINTWGASFAGYWKATDFGFEYLLGAFNRYLRGSSANEYNAPDILKIKSPYNLTDVKDEYNMRFGSGANRWLDPQLENDRFVIYDQFGIVKP